MLICGVAVGNTLHNIRAITLDLDDTLWEIGPVIRRAEADLWQWLSDNYPEIPRKFSTDDLLQLRLQVANEFQEHSHDFRFLRKKVLEQVALDCGYTTDLVDPAFAVFDAARNRVEFYPDVLPALEELSNEFTVIAVTNGNANLQTIGIRHLFHEVVTAVSAGCAKPGRPIFDEAVSRAGVQAAEVLHVGDHPAIDIVGAMEAGLRTAWMNRNGNTWPGELTAPDAEVNTVAELRTLLQPGDIEHV